MPFTAEELENLKSEWKYQDKEIQILGTIDEKLLDCGAFQSLISLATETDTRDIIAVTGTTIAILEIGIAIGRAQTTRELCSKIEGV